MSTQRDLRIRNQTILLLLLPVTLFLFAAGWLLYFFGDRTSARPPQRNRVLPQDDGIQMHVATAEETEQYND